MRAHGTINDNNENVNDNLNVVIQERSHDSQLGSFYQKYFCDLIEKGELPYLSKTSCGEYGSQRRKVYGLSKLAKKIDENSRLFHHQHQKNHVKIASPDGEAGLRDQIKGGYDGASLMVLGHGGGMVYALFLNTNSTVIEITPPSKHIEYNGAALGLVTIAKAKKLKVRRIVCYEGGAFVVDLMDPVQVIASQDSEKLQSLLPFNGDVSDVTTHCGKLVHNEINKFLVR
jgi:hypothetical protein